MGIVTFVLNVLDVEYLSWKWCSAAQPALVFFYC